MTIRHTLLLACACLASGVAGAGNASTTLPRMWGFETLHAIETTMALPGGLYAEELKAGQTTSTAPAAAAALRLHMLTNNRQYLDAATRLYEWTNARLRDSDNLFFDHVRLDGTVEKTKWSYNSALMIRTCCLLHQATGEAKYLEEARRIARAARAHWVDAASGAIMDEACFAHLLCEAFLAVEKLDGDRQWRGVVLRALAHLHDSVRDSRGRYGRRWDRRESDPLPGVRLIDWASAARGYLWAAKELATPEPVR